MSTIKDALDRARGEAQDLHKKMDATTAKDNTALRAEAQSAGTKAQQLADSLKATVDGRRAHAQQHVKDAAAQLQDAAKQAREIATAPDAQLKAQSKALLGNVRDAAQSLSHAVAEQRRTLAAK